MQKSLFMKELKEESSQSPATSNSLERKSSFVKKNVKKETFSLKQLMSELRVADTALNMRKDFIRNLLQFCM